jgi:hypothetical protein
MLKKTDTRSGVGGGGGHEVNKTAAYLGMMRYNVVGRSTLQTKLLPVKLHGITFKSSVAAVLSVMGVSNFTL